MARVVGNGSSATGLALGIAASMLWVSPLALRRLDALVLALFVIGLTLSIVGYARGATVRARRIGIIGIGINAVGFAIVLLPYAAG